MNLVQVGVILICILRRAMSENLSIKQDILDELSWVVKLKILEDYFASKSIHDKSRRVGVEFLTLDQRRQGPPHDQAPVEITPSPADTDDNNMRLKLFRLMYETVRDSDLKFKRAELIKTHYSNSSAFEVGYIMGEVTDKFNIISDISATLKRLYHEWTPIEHINAYEQIANQAIEISHLIDIARLVSKRNKTSL